MQGLNRWILSASSRDARDVAYRAQPLGVAQWWARAVAAAWVIVGSAACGSDYTGGSTPTETQHVLRVQASGSGSGMVTAPDASPPLSCTITSGALSGVCAGAYPRSSAVQLVATPNGASTFTGWSGACTGSGDCVVDMSQERTVTASFVPGQR